MTASYRNKSNPWFAKENHVKLARQSVSKLLVDVGGGDVSGVMDVDPEPPGGVVVDESASVGATFSDVTINDIAYRVAVFTGAGTLVVTSPGEVQALIVGSGGSGGRNSSGVGGGGGGAGGIYPNPTTPFMLEAGSHLVVVGAAATTTVAGLGNYGSDSLFAGRVAVGGGRGVHRTGGVGGDGGSGGGGSGDTVGGSAGGAGVAGQGNNGGAGYNGTQAYCGGGGGAIGVGLPGNPSGANLGGAGLGMRFYSEDAVTFSVGGSGHGAAAQANYGGPGCGGHGVSNAISTSMAGIVAIRWFK